MTTDFSNATPRPWRFVEIYTNGTGEIQPINSDFHWIAKHGDPGRSAEENRDNGALIAAAVNAYKACNTDLSYIKDIARNAFYDSDGTNDDGINAAVDAIAPLFQLNAHQPSQPDAVAVHLRYAMELLEKASEFISELAAVDDPETEEFVWRHQYTLFLDPASGHPSFTVHGKPADHAHPPAASARIAELEEALKMIAEAHLPDQPAAYDFSEYAWAVRHIGRLRGMARAALAGGRA